MDKSIFRAYDIRGIYPAELDEQTAYLIGHAMYRYLGGPRTAAVGRDARLMAPQIQQAVMMGLADAGAEVVDLGMVSSDTRSFAAGKLGYDLAICVTASHNPKEWIGMKAAKSGGIEVGGAGELAEIGTIVEELVADGSLQYSARTPIVFPVRDIMSEWIDHALGLIDVAEVKPMRVVVDAGNGVAGPMMRELAKRLPLDIVEMYFEPDGSFPNHLPSPIEPENTEALRKRVVEEQADLGMAFDGDADRIFFVDEKGVLVTGSETTALIIDGLLAKDPNQTVLYNAICGWNVRDVLAKYPMAKGYRTKVGHGFIKKDMKSYDADFAGEHSGHYFFKDNFGADSGLVTVVIALAMISRRNQKMSEILAEYRRYVQIPETNFRVPDIKFVLDGIIAKYATGEPDTLDGLTLWFDDWWMNVRGSSTEPLLRLNIEATNQQLLDEKTSELTGTITQLSQDAALLVRG